MGGKVGNLYHDPARTPSKEEKRLMFALLLEKMILGGDGHPCVLLQWGDQAAAGRRPNRPKAHWSSSKSLHAELD